MLVTERDFIDNISKILGVKSVSLYPQEAGKIMVTVHYSFWTYLFPGLKYWLNKRVCEYIYGNRACNISVSVNGKEV